MLSTHAEEYDRKFPYFRRPTIVGDFSVDGERQLLADRSRLHYFVQAKGGDVKLDLNAGMKGVVRKGLEVRDEGLSHMLRWISMNVARFQTKETESSPVSLNTDFVCFRGLMTLVMATPYENREVWHVTAVKWKGTIYLCKEDTDEQRRREIEANDRQKTMSSWGYKFEQMVTADTPTGTPPDPEETVNENEEFCCVYRTRVEDLSVVYGAEMDAILPSESSRAARDKSELNLNREEFVEMKTSRALEHRGQERSFARFKLIKWWCQSFLVGIGRVACGFRDDDGVVHEIRHFALADMVKMGADHWAPNVCMNFLLAFLRHVKHTVGDEELIVHRFSWSPERGRRVTSERLNSTQMTFDTLLPKWYRDTVFNVK